MPSFRFTDLPRSSTRGRSARATASGSRIAITRQERAGNAAPAAIEQDVLAPIDGQLDAADLARVLTGFRGQPISVTPAMHYVRASGDGEATAYVFDEESGMVYILD
jgi:hypothetical protein